MIKILCCSPFLENLTIREFSQYIKHEASQTDVPKCLETSLKTIKVMGLSRYHKLENLTYFLENALVLKKLIINYDFWSTEDFKVKVPDMLSKIPKASPACQFHFC